jgi:hypothetical protein
MKQTDLYLWYPLLQAQWDRCDQQITILKHYLVKDIIYNAGREINGLG